MRFVNNDMFKDLKVVTSLNLINAKKKIFDSEGIFSPSIFGSQDFSCECGRLKGGWHAEEVCESCGTKPIDPKYNIYKTGCLKLPYDLKIFNPVIYMIICKYIPSFELKINPQNKHIDINGHFIYNIDDETELVNFLDFSRNYKEVIDKLIPDEVEYSFEDEETNVKIENKINLKQFLLNNEDSVMLSYIPLLPLHLRPSNLTEKQMQLEPLNKCYIAINTHINSITNNIDIEDDTAVEKELFEIQKLYMELTDKILDTISSKEGLMRDQILSNRICYSGRAVITLKDDNDPESITIPRIMFTEIYTPKITSLLVNYLNLNYTEAYEYYFLNRFNLDDEWIEKCINDILLTKPIVLLNRNPTLHLLSIQAFYIKGVTKDNTIKLCKQTLRGLNGDFDGDTVAIFTIDTEEAKKEAEALMIRNNILSHKYIGINADIMPYQDSALGLWLMDAKNAM